MCLSLSHRWVWGVHYHQETAVQCVIYLFLGGFLSDEGGGEWWRYQPAPEAFNTEVFVWFGFKANLRLYINQVATFLNSFFLFLCQCTRWTLNCPKSQEHLFTLSFISLEMRRRFDFSHFALYQGVKLSYTGEQIFKPWSKSGASLSIFNIYLIKLKYIYSCSKTKRCDIHEQFDLFSKETLVIYFIFSS